MGLRLFADQCIPTIVTESFSSAGFEVLILKDFLPIESVDSVVISKAQKFRSWMQS